MRSWLFLEDVLRDMRFAMRQLRKSPGFTTAAVLTLALGIGTATAMFAVVNDVLLQPLPFPNAPGLYEPVGIDAKGHESDSALYTTIQRWRETTDRTAQIAFTGESQAVLDTPRGAQLIGNVASSANLLPILGVQPVLGRSFLPEEAEDGKSHVVLLSYAMWREAFSADPHILEKTVRIDGVPYAVIGVMPPRFSFPIVEHQAEVWTPLERSRLTASSANNNIYREFYPVVLLEQGARPASVQAALSGVQAAVARMARPGDETPTHIRLTSMRDSLVGDIRPALTALEIAVALVWFIACSNVAGLLLARFAARRTEIAVRGALGAGTLRLVRQFLTESLLLSFASALAGLGLAAMVLRAFRHMLQRSLPLPVSIHLHWQVYATLIGLSLVTALAAGVIPAAMAAHAPPEAALKSGGRSTNLDRGQSRLRNLLLVSEVAVSVILLVASGLMLRTVHSLEHVPLGFRTDHIVFTNLTIPVHVYKDSDMTTVWQPLLERVQRVPGVQAAALSTVLPIGHTINWLTLVYKTGWTKGDVSAEVRAASPDLLQVLGIRLRAGRFFTAQDTADSMPAAVVNQTFVNQYLGGGNAVGEQIRFGRVPSAATIVGVLEDVHQDAIATPSQAELYLCMNQIKPGSSLYLPLMGRFMQLAVRTHSAPGAMVPELSRVIREQNPELGIGDVSTMDQSVADSIGTQRMAAGVIGSFGGLALLITVVGLYGLLTYAVTQRTREIGIRMALGADRMRLVWLFLGKAVFLLASGIAIGLAASFWSSRFLESFLYGVGKHDPWTLVLGPAVLLFSGMVAAIIPAGRAASVEPMQALRME